MPSMSKAGVVLRLVLALLLLTAAGVMLAELQGPLRWGVSYTLMFFGVLQLGQARTKT